MNARVFLLVLVTGSFMAIWNSDEQAMKVTLALRQQALNHQIAQADIACESDIRPAGLGIHERTEETEVFVGDLAETTISGEAEPVGSQIEITAEELLEAAEVEVIELESHVDMASDVPMAEEFAAEEFAAQEFTVESRVHAIAPEDVRVNTQPLAHQTIPAFAFADSHNTLRDFELNHASRHIINPILASIEDALAGHDNEPSQDDSQPIDVALTEEPVPASLKPDQDVQQGHKTSATEGYGAEGEKSVHAQNGEQAHVAVAPKQYEDAVPVARDAEPSALVEQKNEGHSASEVKPIIPMEGPSIPLPANLANGTWQVVDTDGNSFKITIDRSAPRGSAKKVAEDAEAFEENFCIRTAVSGERWCFVRSYETASASKRVATEFFAPMQTSPGRE